MVKLEKIYRTSSVHPSMSFHLNHETLEMARTEALDQPNHVRRAVTCLFCLEANMATPKDLPEEFRSNAAFFQNSFEPRIPIVETQIVRFMIVLERSRSLSCDLESLRNI